MHTPRYIKPPTTMERFGPKYATIWGAGTQPMQNMAYNTKNVALGKPVGLGILPAKFWMALKAEKIRK